MPLGPAGGYTPADIRRAYGIPDSVGRQRPLIAVVDAFNDPSARSDLNHFDRNYSMRRETGRSFRKLSETGHSTGLPPNEPGWAGEETVDLQAIRGLCPRCRIVLVEAATQTPSDLAKAEDTAARLHPSVISNSFGYDERTVQRSLSRAFNHPGIVIVASDGDDGMNDWDLSNPGFYPPSSAPEWPASLRSVVAVGGTSLYLRQGGGYVAETTWNNDGPDDNAGSAAERSMGATGGGCSTMYAAPKWQLAVRGWGDTGCGRYRLTADVALDADPFTGYDAYQSYGTLYPGWATYGGTSLAAPLLAAMYADAGGAHGVTDPAVGLYRRLAITPKAVHDIEIGGNGFCGGDSAKHCLVRAGGNPNTLVGAFVDCSFGLKGDRIRRHATACNAAPGYDGPTGVGSPASLHSLEPLPLNLRMEARRSGRSYQFGVRVLDPTPGAGRHVTAVWHWRDGTKPTTGTHPRHEFRVDGMHVVRVKVTDRFGESGESAITVLG